LKTKKEQQQIWLEAVANKPLEAAITEVQEEFMGIIESQANEILTLKQQIVELQQQMKQRSGVLESGVEYISIAYYSNISNGDIYIRY
jgi:hypothetical protein